MNIIHLILTSTLHVPRRVLANVALAAAMLGAAPIVSLGQSAEDDSLLATAVFATRHAALNGRLYFAADNGVNGNELWVSDGTAAGTFMLKDIASGASASDPDCLTVVGNRIFFSAKSGTNAGLWITDGTAAGTVLLRNFPGTASIPRFLAAAGNLCYFAGTESATGMEPWMSDGTAAGTRLVADLKPGTASSAPLYFTNVDGTVFFAAEASTTTTTGKGKKKSTVTTSTGVELWKTNGTAAGTVLVKDIAPGSNHSLPTNLFAWNGALYFSAHFPNAGNELMRSDGTAAGTVLVKDLVSGSMSSNPRGFRTHAGKLLFNAHGSNSGIWQTDGTAAGTVPANVLPGVPGFVYSDFVVLGTRIVARAETGGGLQLWSTDGATSTQLFTLNPADGFPEAFLGTMQFGNRLLFTALTHELGFDLYITDGTAAGTALVKDFQPGANSVPEPLFLGPVQNGVLLTAADGPSGHELHITNGTTAGTVIVTDIQPD
ncbi:MAG TPA: ELWxxDGT repeat protein [Opitutaceae bacterium]|nr:ELWxxDGT repeat protein [Opitutaceae bacterium]